MSAALIRLAAADDFAALCALEAQSFTSDAISARQMRYLLHQAKAQSWVATLDQQVVAYATVLLPRAPRPARVYSLAVAQAHRGQGIASALLTTLQHHIRQLGYTRLRLEVASHNLAAQRLYQQHGFQPLKILPAYYQDGSDALRMQWDDIAIKP